MTRRPGWRGGKRWSRADSEKPDDTKTLEVAAGPKKCHGALAPLPNRQASAASERSEAKSAARRVMRPGRGGEPHRVAR